MTRADAIAELKESFGSEAVAEQPLPYEPGLTLVIITEKQAIPNSTQTTQVAFKLPADITARPQHFVETHLVLPDGHQPNNVSKQELHGRPSQACPQPTSWARSTY